MGWLSGFSSSDLAGRGGASIYGKQFEDELHPDLKFTGKSIMWPDWVGKEESGSEKLPALAVIQGECLIPGQGAMSLSS